MQSFPCGNSTLKQQSNERNEVDVADSLFGTHGLQRIPVSWEWGEARQVTHLCAKGMANKVENIESLLSWHRERDEPQALLRPWSIFLFPLLDCWLSATNIPSSNYFECYHQICRYALLGFCFVLLRRLKSWITLVSPSLSSEDLPRNHHLQAHCFLLSLLKWLLPLTL